MEIFLSLMIFIMGTFFGSFFTLAVYRIPLKKDITHEHSFCPNCNHKLGVLDLIPVWSYIFLKGKCRYCGEKVRIRYLILEVLSGFVFLLFYLSLNIQDIFCQIDKSIFLLSCLFMYVTMAIVGGIDKEYQTINVSVLLFGVSCQMIYMLYLYIIEGSSMYRYIIYFIIFVILCIIHKIANKEKTNYLWEIVLLLCYIVFTLDLPALLIILTITLLGVFVISTMQKSKYNTWKKIPFGFVICFFTVLYQIVENFINFYR